VCFFFYSGIFFRFRIFIGCRFIDFLLMKYGKINRDILIDFFGISEATATRDFKKYKELYPNNMVFDGSSKTYLKAPLFDSGYT